MTLTWWHHVVWFCTLSHQCILPATCFEDLPTFICPSELSVSWLHLQLGLAKQSHLHRNWWSLPTNSSLKKRHHILPSFGGAVKSKNTSLHQMKQPKFEEFECKQATCHCCKEAVDAFPCCRFPCVFPLGL